MLLHSSDALLKGSITNDFHTVMLERSCELSMRWRGRSLLVGELEEVAPDALPGNTCQAPQMNALDTLDSIESVSMPHSEPLTIWQTAKRSSFPAWMHLPKISPGWIDAGASMSPRDLND